MKSDSDTIDYGTVGGVLNLMDISANNYERGII